MTLLSTNQISASQFPGLSMPDQLNWLNYTTVNKLMSATRNISSFCVSKSSQKTNHEYKKYLPWICKNVSCSYRRLSSINNQNILKINTLHNYSGALTVALLPQRISGCFSRLKKVVTKCRKRKGWRWSHKREKNSSNEWLWMSVSFDNWRLKLWRQWIRLEECWM
jgi:hypothetical protein